MASSLQPTTEAPKNSSSAPVAILFHMIYRYFNFYDPLAIGFFDHKVEVFARYGISAFREIPKKLEQKTAQSFGFAHIFFKRRFVGIDNPEEIFETRFGFKHKFVLALLKVVVAFPVEFIAYVA